MSRTTERRARHIMTIANRVDHLSADRDHRWLRAGRDEACRTRVARSELKGHNPVGGSVCAENRASMAPHADLDQSNLLLGLPTYPHRSASARHKSP